MADPNYGDLQSYLSSLPNMSRDVGSPGVAGKPDKEDVDYFYPRDENNFFWFNRKYRDDPLVTGYNYLFVTSPELPIWEQSPSLRGGGTNILEHNGKMLGLPGANRSSIYSEYMLQALGGASAFIPILTNRAVSYVMSDDVLGTVDYSETWNRFKIVLGSTAKDSRISGQFTANYMEDMQLTIMKLHRLWLDYTEKAFMGDCVSGGVLLSDDMLNNGVRTIDYMSSIYQFAVQPDGETITHWCKYTGVFPTKVPWGELTSEDGSIDIKKSIPIEYQFSYKEDMSLHILQDFNLLGQGSGLNDFTGNFYTGSEVLLPSSPNDRYPSVIAAGKDTYTGLPLFKLVFPDNSRL